MISSSGLLDSLRRHTEPNTRVALVAQGQLWTYGELLDTAAELAAQLTCEFGSGCQPLTVEVADPVGTALAVLAGELAGLCVVHRDPAAPDRPHGLMIHDGRVRTPGADDIACAGGRLWLTTDGDSGLPRDLPPGSQVFLTSGSTNTPTAVVRTADAVLADARRVAEFLGYAPDGSVVCAAPVFHVYGFNYGLVATLLAGTTMRWCPPRMIPSQLARAAKEIGARTLIALPAHYGLLAAQADLAGEAWDGKLATLRVAVSAGAPLGAGVAAAITKRFRFGLYNCYGSSEAGAVTLTHLDGSAESGWIGTPLPGVTAAVERPDGATGVGELLLRTSSLGVERIRQGERAPLARPDGWYPTGDLAVADPEGKGFHLVGRAASVINVAGEKVSPGQVERVLATHPHVVDVQVVADSDPARGQVPVARIVLSEAGALGQLTAWCRARMAPHEVPRRFDVVLTILRSATGKPLAVPDEGPPERGEGG